MQRTGQAAEEPGTNGAIVLREALERLAKQHDYLLLDDEDVEGREWPREAERRATEELRIAAVRRDPGEHAERFPRLLELASPPTAFAEREQQIATALFV